MKREHGPTMINGIKKKIYAVASDPRTKSLLNWLGLGLGILGIIFIVYRFRGISDEINISAISKFQWAGILLGCAAYSGACVIQAFAWHNILEYLKLPVKPIWSIPTFGISQMAKYIPGNVFQFASRQAIGVSEGLPGIPLAKSIIWELGLMAGTAFLFAIFIIPNYNKNVSTLLTILIFILILIVLLFVIGLFIGRRISNSIGLFAIFFSITSAIFIYLLTLILGWQAPPGFQLITLCGIYIFSWLIGFITPGAPAGVGVREIVLFSLLSPFIPEGILLLAIVVMRFITVGGDLFFYGVSWGIRHKTG
jgi:glycosyltransferase 2 family protein